MIYIYIHIYIYPKNRCLLLKSIWCQCIRTADIAELPPFFEQNSHPRKHRHAKTGGNPRLCLSSGSTHLQGSLEDLHGSCGKVMKSGRVRGFWWILIKMHRIYVKTWWGTMHSTENMGIWSRSATPAGFWHLEPRKKWNSVSFEACHGLLLSKSSSFLGNSHFLKCCIVIQTRFLFLHCLVMFGAYRIPFAIVYYVNRNFRTLNWRYLPYIRPM